jgi:hypothetical protein
LQGLALVFAAEQFSPLRLGNNLVDEVLEAFRNVREHDIEAVASLFKKPLRHFFGDRRWRANECEPAEAACDLSKLSDRQVVTLCERDEALTSALAGVRFGDFREDTIDIKVRGVADRRRDSAIKRYGFPRGA